MVALGGLVSAAHYAQPTTAVAAWTLRALALPLLVTAALACASADADSPSPPTPADGVSSGERWVYWLQDPDPDVLTDRDEAILVIDYSRDGTEDAALSRDEVTALRAGVAEPRTVLAYLSIGEAEDYRFYWEPTWRTAPPEWVERENPDWPGNFKVRYWRPDWQSIIFGNPDAYLDHLIAAGFSGVYLDIIDGYEYFQDLGRSSAEDEMVEFVRSISSYAKARAPGFLIVPQNAPELGRRADYLEAVDGVAQEGLYYGFDEEGAATDPAVTELLEAHLDRFVEANKLVLVVDYTSSSEQTRDAHRRAWSRGYASTAASVRLDGLPRPE